MLVNVYTVVTYVALSREYVSVFRGACTYRLHVYGTYPVHDYCMSRKHVHGQSTIFLYHNLAFIIKMYAVVTHRKGG